jgi:hypothetical protein
VLFQGAPPAGYQALWQHFDILAFETVDQLTLLRLAMPARNDLHIRLKRIRRLYCTSQRNVLHNRRIADSLLRINRGLSMHW